MKRSALVVAAAMFFMANMITLEGSAGGQVTVDIVSAAHAKSDKNQQTQKEEKQKKQKKNQKKENKCKKYSPTFPEVVPAVIEEAVLEDVVYVNEAGEGAGIQDEVDSYRNIDMSLEYHVPSVTKGWVVSDVLEAPDGLAKDKIHFRAKVTARDLDSKKESACVDLYYSSDEFFSREYDNKLDSTCIKLESWKERKAQFPNFTLELGPGRHFFFIDVIHGTHADISDSNNFSEFVEIVIGSDESEVITPEVVVEPEIIEPVDIVEPEEIIEPAIVEPETTEPQIAPLQVVVNSIEEPEVNQPQDIPGMMYADCYVQGWSTLGKWVPVTGISPAEMYNIFTEFNLKNVLWKYFTIPSDRLGAYQLKAVVKGTGQVIVHTFFIRSGDTRFLQ